jgi:hypothetical protein
VKESEALALFPGGFGTMDEGFEVLTLIQTGKSAILPIVMVDAPGGTYWKTFEAFLRGHLLERKLISEEDFSLFMITDDVEAAVHEVKHFYRVFHSYRFVKDRIVFRLQRRLSQTQLAELNTRFTDIVKTGLIMQEPALPEEQDETAIAHLPRLIFVPNKRNYGRFREFINAINDFDPDRQA